MTDQPYAINRLSPFRVHHDADPGTLPALLIAGRATGAWRDAGTRLFLPGMYGPIVANHLLTDRDDAGGERRR